MRRIVTLVSLSCAGLLMWTSVTQAQGRKTRGETEANWDAIAKGGASGPSISARDIDAMNIVHVLVEKKKDLKLSAEQLERLKTMESALKEKNAPLGRAVDSLRKQMRVSGTPSAEDEARMAISRDALFAVLKDVQANNEAAVKEAMPVLDETQQKAAAAVVQEQAEENQATLREKMGGRSGGSGGARPPGRRGQ